MLLILSPYLPIEKLTAVIAGFLSVGFAVIAVVSMFLVVSGYEKQYDQYDDYWTHIHLLL